MSARQRLIAALEVSPEVRPGEATALVEAFEAEVYATALREALAVLAHHAQQSGDMYRPGIHFSIGVLEVFARDAAHRQTPAPQSDADEWVYCLHCPNRDRYAKATERGWKAGVTGYVWQCPKCRDGAR